MMRASTFVSVVVGRLDPPDLAARVARTLEVLGQHYENYELILVEDGPGPALAALRPLLAQHQGVRILRLSRAYGPDVARTAGLEAAIGDVVVVADLATDPPELFPTLVDKVRDSGGIVGAYDPGQGHRGALRRLQVQLFEWVARRLVGLQLAPTAPQLYALSRNALNAVVRVKDKQRYLEVFAPYVGFGVDYLPYEPLARRPQRGWFEAVERGVDILVGNSLRPLRLASALGVVASLLNVAYIGYIFAVLLLKDEVAEGWTTLSLQTSGLFLLLFVLLTVLGEYLGRLLAETRDRPLYFVQEELTSNVLVPHEERRNVVLESH